MPAEPNNTIAVAMSGGVDSSAVAALLRSQGHEIIGLTLQLWNQRRLAGHEGMPEAVQGRCCSIDDVYDARHVAEKLDIPVLTNIKVAAAFPTDHRLHAAPPGNRLSAEAKTLVANADVILSLDWLDLGGALKQAFGTAGVTAKIIHV